MPQPVSLLVRAVELLGDDILPSLPVASLVSLGCCNRALHDLILRDGSNEAERVWKNRIKHDLRFPIESTARTEGWRRLYRKIRKAHVYLWGEGRNARLALTRDDPRVNLLSRQGGLAVPARLSSLPCPIVDLVAGGWSFHALGVDGQVLHWGQLDGSAFAPYRPTSSPVPPLAHPGVTVSTPMKLSADLPPMQRLLAGRRHVLALDEEGQVWTWANWAEVGRLGEAWFNPRYSKLVDIAAGWDVSAILTESKTGPKHGSKRQFVRVWWQRFLSPSLRTVDTLGAPGPDRIPGRNGCYLFSPTQVITLPELPLPAGSETGERQRIIKLGAGEEFLVALTDAGRVYKIDLSCPQTPGQAEEEEPLVDDGTLSARRFAEMEAMFSTGRRTWEYLELFSPDVGTADRITHISASFRTFFAIGGGKVLQGSRDYDGQSQPIRTPELQDRGVIRVECGDYHYGALTSQGKLLTFGAYSKGALGHGHDNIRLQSTPQGYQPRPDGSLSSPREVDFYDPLDKRGKRSEEFVFNTAFAGWASSALTVSLDDDDEDEQEGEEEKDSGAVQPAETTRSEEVQNQLNVGHTTPHTRQGIFTPGRFRLGYPARGMGRGVGGHGKGC